MMIAFIWPFDFTWLGSDPLGILGRACNFCAYLESQDQRTFLFQFFPFFPSSTTTAAHQDLYH